MDVNSIVLGALNIGREGASAFGAQAEALRAVQVRHAHRAELFGAMKASEGQRRPEKGNSRSFSRFSAVSQGLRRSAMEARVGIEPAYTALQAAA